MFSVTVDKLQEGKNVQPSIMKPLILLLNSFSILRTGSPFKKILPTKDAISLVVLNLKVMRRGARFSYGLISLTTPQPPIVMNLGILDQVSRIRIIIIIQDPVLKPEKEVC